MKLSPDETSFTHYTHYVCCCSAPSNHDCDCKFDGMVETIGNRFGNVRGGGVEGFGFCPLCETDFRYRDEDDHSL